MKVQSHLTPHTNTNSRRIKKLDIRSKPLRLTEENTGGRFVNTGMERVFVNTSQNPRRVKGKSG